MAIDDNDGFLKLTVSVNGQDHSATVDVYEAHDDLLTLVKDGDGPEVEAAYWQGLKEWASKIGLPQGLSRYVLVNLRNSVFRRAGELSKKDQLPESSGTPN